MGSRSYKIFRYRTDPDQQLLITASPFLGGCDNILSHQNCGEKKKLEKIAINIRFRIPSNSCRRWVGASPGTAPPGPKREQADKNDEPMDNRDETPDKDKLLLLPPPPSVHVAVLPRDSNKDVNDNYHRLSATEVPRPAASFPSSADGGGDGQAEAAGGPVDRKGRCPCCGIVLLRKNLARHLRDQHLAVHQPRQVSIGARILRGIWWDQQRWARAFSFLVRLCYPKFSLKRVFKSVYSLSPFTDFTSLPDPCPPFLSFFVLFRYFLGFCFVALSTVSSFLFGY